MGTPRNLQEKMFKFSSVFRLTKQSFHSIISPDGSDCIYNSEMLSSSMSFCKRAIQNYLKSLLLVPSSGDLSFTSLVSEWTSPPLPLKSIITQEMSASYRLIHDGGRVEKVGLQFRSLSSILWWGLQDSKEQTLRIEICKVSFIYKMRH